MKKKPTKKPKQVKAWIVMIEDKWFPLTIPRINSRLEMVKPKGKAIFLSKKEASLLACSKDKVVPVLITILE